MSVQEYLTKEEILKLGETDPELVIWKDTHPFSNPYWKDPVSLRAMREPQVKASFEALGDAGIEVKVPVRDGHISALRVYKPQVQDKGSPLVVLLFGGAFLIGDNRQLAPYARALSALYRATVVLPSYRLAPEHPFPAAQNDVWDTLIWLSQYAACSLGADPCMGFILGGVSAGGNLAAALGQKWVDEQMSPKLTGLWLSVPAIFHGIEHVPAEYRSEFLAREQNKTGDVIDAEALHNVRKLQRPDVNSPLYGPFNSPNPDRHANIGRSGVRVYFQVAGQDILRDDGLIYERVLRKSGVETRIDVYPGVPHAHFSFFPFLTAARQSNLDTLRQFAWLLRTDEPRVERIVEFLAAPSGA